MTQLAGNSALLRAFLADAGRYLDEFMGTLALPVEADAETSMGVALEALRGIRIGAEFLEIRRLADLCRQQENYLVSVLGSPLQEDVRDTLMRAGREIDVYLQALGGVREPAAGGGDRQPPPAGQDAAGLVDIRQESLAPSPPVLGQEDAVAPSMGTTEAGGSPPEKPPADAVLPGKAATRDAGSMPELASRKGLEHSTYPGAFVEGAEATEALGDKNQQSASVTEMFQEWMREWRAFREQIARLYLGPASGVVVAEIGSDNALPHLAAETTQATSQATSEPAEESPSGKEVIAPASAAPPLSSSPQRAAQPAAAEPMAVLKVSVGDTLYALPASKVLGFVEPRRDLAPLSVNMGLAAVNDSAVPVVDLRQCWDLGERPADARIVLVESDHGRVGLWADRVHGTESLRIQPLAPRDCYPAALDGAALSAQGEVVLLLLPERIAGSMEGA